MSKATESWNHLPTTCLSSSCLHALLNWHNVPHWVMCRYKTFPLCAEHLRRRKRALGWELTSSLESSFSTRNMKKRTAAERHWNPLLLVNKADAEAPPGQWYWKGDTKSATCRIIPLSRMLRGFAGLKRLRLRFNLLWLLGSEGTLLQDGMMLILILTQLLGPREGQIVGLLFHCHWFWWCIFVFLSCVTPFRGLSWWYNRMPAQMWKMQEMTIFSKSVFIGNGSLQYAGADRGANNTFTV